MYTCVCCAWSILNVMFFIIVYPVGVLEVPVKVWESLMVCTQTKKPQIPNK